MFLKSPGVSPDWTGSESPLILKRALAQKGFYYNLYVSPFRGTQMMAVQVDTNSE